jgi:hypothetical protein
MAIRHPDHRLFLKKQSHLWQIIRKTKNLPEVGLRAGDGIRTREYQLGRLMPYHLATPAKHNPDFTLSAAVGQALAPFRKFIAKIPKLPLDRKLFPRYPIARISPIEMIDFITHYESFKTR